VSNPTELGLKEAEMRIIGCDLHARQQTIAMLDTDTGELEQKTLEHQGETVREFYSALPGPVRVGIEATGSMQWFLELPVRGNSEACCPCPVLDCTIPSGWTAMLSKESFGVELFLAARHLTCTIE
jgi:hypothetical protein